METPQIRVKTEGFRAIAKADIIINGITVVAGENGSGKSTLSKLLYYLYTTASNYDTLVAGELERNLRDVEHFLDIIEHEFRYAYKERDKKQELRGIEKELSELRRNNTIDEEQMAKWIAVIRKASELYSSHPFNEKENILRTPIIRRLRYIIKDILNEKIDEKDENTQLPFDKIIEFVEFQFKSALNKVKTRPTSLFIQALKNVFVEGRLPEVFEVFEFGEMLGSLDKDVKHYLSIPYSVQNVIYVDTPMLIGVSNSDNQYWNDLNKLLRKNGELSYSNLSHLISNEIINGDVSVVEESNSSFLSDFMYRRADGLPLNLLDCATGIKAFAILQLLLKNGSLTDKTLLIIDEPESNLHPQWIIEYARLIVLLNKEIGMKFFIATHNPDMVSALKYISMKEGTDKNLNFYLAESTNKDYLYDYKLLEQNIDPIFKSFNIAMDRINQYGV